MTFESQFWLNNLVANKVYYEWEALSPIVNKKLEELESWMQNEAEALDTRIQSMEPEESFFSKMEFVLNSAGKNAVGMFFLGEIWLKGIAATSQFTLQCAELVREEWKKLWENLVFFCEKVFCRFTRRREG